MLISFQGKRLKKITALFLVSFSSFLFAFQSSFLMPEQAFKPKAELQTDQSVSIDIALAEGIYVYADKLEVKVKSPAEVSIASLDIKTEPEAHDGDRVYMHDIPIAVTLDVSRAKKPLPVTLALDYQGCSDKGLCYEPQHKEYTFTVDPGKVATESTQAASLPTLPDAEAASAAAPTGGSETDLIVDALKGGNLWTILALFFGFGLALSLTPCIFPMIPILSSIIVSQGENITMRRGFTLSLVYVLAMAVAYTIAGIAAGMFGQNLQVILQNPWAIGGFALIFVALAFSMFGFYEIGLPAALQTKLTHASDKAGEQGGFAGVAVMGFLSALIVGPCVAPGLAAALIYIGQTGNAALGGAALFVMSLGMGVPLLLIGLGAGKFMPRPGGWMNTVTEVFGAVMMGIAIWMVSRSIPDWITMMLWAIFFIVSAVYLGAFEPLKDGVRRSWQSFIKAIGIVVMLYGTILLVGALSGGTSMMHPLKGFEVKLCDKGAQTAST
ncbi:MAG TPA: protein-disulfide reductase DsbD, partial [Sulfuricurvum sp.]|nr:protein-disulfide reductase DsbD [Sulfuricurvum sp.]